MKGRTKPVSRRALMAAAGTALLWLTQARMPRAWAQEKVSKEKAEYQDTPKDIRMCATCSLFLPPKACKVVEGDVRPSGWCNLYDLAD